MIISTTLADQNISAVPMVASQPIQVGGRDPALATGQGTTTETVGTVGRHNRDSGDCGKT